MQTKALIHVIDDDESFRTSLMRMLTVEGFNAVGYRSAGDYLLTHLEADDVEQSSCMLLDISMPGPSGIDLMKVLVSRESTPPIIFITGRDDVFTCVDALKCGAFDYVLKPGSAERVLAAVRKAIAVDAARRTARHELHELRARFNTLSPGERLVFFGIVNHRLNKQMAADLGACERTIKTRRALMMEKLQIDSIPELVKAARLLEQSRDPESSLRNPTPTFARVLPSPGTSPAWPESRTLTPR
jgi:FixJ family two-component response regulator